MVVKLGVTFGLTAMVVFVAKPGLANTEKVAIAGDLLPDRVRTTYGVVPVITAALLLLKSLLGVYQPRRWRLRDGASMP